MAETSAAGLGWAEEPISGARLLAPFGNDWRYETGGHKVAPVAARNQTALVLAGLVPATVITYPNIDDHERISPTANTLPGPLRNQFNVRSGMTT